MAIHLNPAATGMGAYPMRELKDLANRLRAEGRPVWDFTVGDPLEPTPDFIRRALIEGVPEVSQYPTVRGQPALRQAAAGFVRRRFGITVDPDREILPSTGSKEAIFHLANLVLDPGAERRGVLYGEPGYPVYERGATLAGGVPMPVPLSQENNFLLDPELVSAEAARRVQMVWLNYPHNPTGAVASAAELTRIVNWCRDHEVLLCADECYIDTYFDEPPASVLDVCGDDRTGVLVFFSCSKRSGMTGFRTGFVCGDPDVLAAYASMRDAVGAATQDFVQHAAVAAWSDDRHAAQRRAIFAAKRAVFDELFADLGLEVAGSQATFYIWVKVPGGLATDAWCKQLIEAGIVVTPGASFGPSGDGYVRLALVPTLDQCRHAAAAWRAIPA